MTCYLTIEVFYFSIPEYLLMIAKNISQDATSTEWNSFWQIWVEEFSREIESWDTILIDIRTTEELEIYGTISENQSHIIFGTETFAEQILELDRNKKYLLYCWHWHRSAVTREFMQEQWFTWVKDLAWGIDRWNKIM